VEKPESGPGATIHLDDAFAILMQCVSGGVVFLGQTDLEQSRLVLGRFFYVLVIRSAIFNSRRDQSDRSDFALTKTCD